MRIFRKKDPGPSRGEQLKAALEPGAVRGCRAGQDETLAAERARKQAERNAAYIAEGDRIFASLPLFVSGVGTEAVLASRCPKCNGRPGSFEFQRLALYANEYADCRTEAERVSTSYGRAPISTVVPKLWGVLVLTCESCEHKHMRRPLDSIDHLPSATGK